jgi:hypothetical protein
VTLVEQGLRIDVQAVAQHGAHLALEREMVEVFGDHNLDGEVDRVTRTREQLQRPGGRLDTGSALAAVLLTLDLTQHEAPLEHANLFRLVELAMPLGQTTAA